MNTVERKRLAILNKRLRSSDPRLRIDMKNLNELKELKELNHRRHHEEHLEICSVETERIRNTTTRSDRGIKPAERLGVRNRPRAVQLRTRRVSKPENDLDAHSREVSSLVSSMKGSDPASIPKIPVNDPTSIPKMPIDSKGAAALWSKDKISSISLVEKELSKRPEQELSRKAANRIRAPGTAPVLPSACEKSIQSVDPATFRSRMRPRAISSRRKFSGTSIGNACVKT